MTFNSPSNDIIKFDNITKTKILDSEEKKKMLENKRALYKERLIRKNLLKNTIQKHLIDRYINGHKIKDPRYDKIFDYFVVKIQNKKEKNFSKLLDKELGDYNIITAEIYQELATKYFLRKYKKIPKINQIFHIINDE